MKSSNTSPDMKTSTKILILVFLIAGVAGVLALKQNRNASASTEERAVLAPALAASNSEEGASHPLPRLVDLGAERCIPCRMMAPILDELKREHAGTFETIFIDVWKNPEAGKAYGVEMIPTQIFFDADGQERFRHVGFYGKEEILSKWKELGVNVDP
jgi:thioredoxin 1